MDTLLFIYALVVFAGMAAGIEDKSTGGLYILGVLLWPITLVFIIGALLYDKITDWI